MSNINKNGLVITSNCYENDAMNTYAGKSSDYFQYTPAKDTNNSCSGNYTWYTPEGTVTGDRFRVQLFVEYNGFDSSSTAGTFNIYFQGSRWDNVNQEWTWNAGSSSIVTALNSQMSLKTLVLSATKGTYQYDAVFAIPEDNVTRYTGQRLQIRCNYSNGTGVIKIINLRVIPDKYSISITQPYIGARIGPNYIASGELIEI